LVKALAAEGLEVRSLQYKAFRKYVSEKRTVNVSRALEDALKD
jgi:hypothetical protein